MSRPAVVVALPREESIHVCAELREAGIEFIAVDRPEQLILATGNRSDIGLAILDGESDLDLSLEFYSILHDEGRSIAALIVVSPKTLERLSRAPGSVTAQDEYFTRPFSADALRWRVEAMLIRAMTVDDGSGVILNGPIDVGEWGRRALIVAVFNPKGGVGKTTVAINLAATLQVRRGKRVLIVDADTVTGHIASSLGLEHVRTVVDSRIDEAEGGTSETYADLAAAHPSGLRVVVLSSTPIRSGALDPAREAEAIGACRRSFDVVVVDMHPDYDGLNRAIFEQSDRIIVPVTPDVPALRAAIQLREVATELGMRDRLTMVVNRANSGVSVTDMERTVGMAAIAQIRSAGLLFVRAANEGRTVIERFPREKVTEDFDDLADKLVSPPKQPASRPALRGIFGRSKEPVVA